jgi:hypothetical protein
MPCLVPCRNCCRRHRSKQQHQLAASVTLGKRADASSAAGLCSRHRQVRARAAVEQCYPKFALLLQRSEQHFPAQTPAA